MQTNQTMNNLTSNGKRRKKRGVILFLGMASLFWMGFYFWPILFESTPPDLKLSGIEAGQIYRGRVRLDISVKDDRPGLGTLTVQIDDGLPQPLGLVGDDTTFWQVETTLLNDGAHTIYVTAADKSLRKNTTQQTVEFLVDNAPPQFQVAPESLQAWQGKTLGVFVQINEPVLELTGRFLNREINFYQPASEDSYRALVGIGVKQSTKSYPLTLNATDVIGNTAEQTFTVEVGATAFQRGGYITLSPEKQQIMMDKSKSREDNAKRAAAYARANRERNQLWEGRFVRPTEGTLTSPFGKYREYNTGVRRHHLGTDIANTVGTPVYAGNHGIATLADRLHIYGNAVVINHGQGVSTSYNHLSEIYVQVGESVKKGQLIGRMGATGQVTGSHLHWGMVINGVAVDPAEWTERDFSPPETRKMSTGLQKTDLE